MPLPGPRQAAEAHQPPVRDRIPILLAAMGPRNVALAAEIAEGWQALFLDPAALDRVFGPALAEGLERRDPALGPLDIMVPLPFAVAEPDPAAAGPATARSSPSTSEGMGARGRNFSNDLVRRYGYPGEAATIQELFLSGPAGRGGGRRCRTTGAGDRAGRPVG
jgi:alkanesulfonate monooxygenase SsuD/methylene tetrahydromethanopterin reductase-like flavin-dependent oxidoreductase (luciferase family)